MAAPIEPMDTHDSGSASRPGALGHMSTYVRPLVAVTMATFEILLTSLLFSFEVDIPFWQHPVYWVRHFQLLLIVAAVAWAIMVWPRRAVIAELWADTGAKGGWLVPLAVNLALFAVLTVATIAFTRHVSTVRVPPWDLFWLYCIPLAATALSLAWLFAPLGFWLELVRRQYAEIVLALAVGIGLLLFGGLARTGWDALAGVTLALSYGLLSLYESTAGVDFSARVLGVREFSVIIDQSCSGYEGMALVSVFLALYLWTFRAALRFPNAFLLIPLGIAAIFALNVVRIAVLVSIGAHFSPDIAIGGFHSQAGWMSFLAVTIGFMVLAPRLKFLSHEVAPRTRTVVDDSDRQLHAFVVPFMTLMAGSILVSATAPFDTWMYAVKIAAATVALLLFRDVYGTLAAPVSWLAVGAGLLVGVAWIATDPGVLPANGRDLGAWLAGQPVWLTVTWLAFRAFGGILIVPVVEELAFRGLLYRWIIARSFETVPFERLSWIALVISSTLFGLMHSRPIAGALAGALFVLLMIRSGRLADAIAAHIAANAAIILWAIATRQWTLL